MSPNVTISFFNRILSRPNGICRGGGEFELEAVEPAAKEIAMAQRRDEFIDGPRLARNRAIDPFMGQQHAAFQGEVAAQCPQRFAQLPEVRQGGKLVKGGNLGGHVRDLVVRF